MGKNSKISWTDHTFNPWWGCTKVSPACQNCYAEALAKRTGFDCWEEKPRRFFGDAHWNEPLKWNKEKAFVFCGSMCDILENVPDVLYTPRMRLFDLIEKTPNLTWLLLTKRPGNIFLIPGFRNIWVGVTVENQTYTFRYHQEVITAQDIKFISCEPLLGEINLVYPYPKWVICGGESGANARPMNREWAIHLRDQCKKIGIPFWFKQWGKHIPEGQTEGMLDGIVYHERPEV